MGDVGRARDGEGARGAEGTRAISHGKLNGRVSAHKAKSYDGSSAVLGKRYLLR